MSPEETFRRVLAARLPAGPGWTAWIDGTVSELAASGVVLTPEEARLLVSTLQRTDEWHAVHFASLAARLEGAS